MHTHETCAEQPIWPKILSLAVSSAVSCGLALNLRFSGQTLMNKSNESTISSVFEQKTGPMLKMSIVRARGEVTFRELKGPHASGRKAI